MFVKLFFKEAGTYIFQSVICQVVVMWSEMEGSVNIVVDQATLRDQMHQEVT
jgi:hypothetical protein